MMKICFFGYINLQKKEGASLSLVNVMEEMVRRGHTVYFVTADKHIIHQMNRMGIKCIYLLSYTMRQNQNETGIKGKVKFFLKNIVNLIAIIRGKEQLKAFDFDVIHINGIDNHVGAAIAAKLKIPYYWHIRQFLQEDLGKRIVGEKVVIKYLQNADGVIGISRAVKEKYESILKREVSLIYNGIPLTNYEVGSVNRFNNDKVRLLLAGRITENKGQLEAVQAIKILKDRGISNLLLTIVGNAEPHYLQIINSEIDKSEIKDNVMILDYCDDLNELRKQSDIGLVCSKNEAFGRVTIEYMCAEMLVIGANTGGTLELIHDEKTGLLYQQGNERDLADKIEYAIQNVVEMRKIAKNSKTYALQNFSIERVCDEILKLYNKVK